MISVTEVRNGMNVEIDGQPWRVLEYRHIKVARGGATIKLKMKNVNTGSTVEKSFKSGEKIAPANITRYPAQFLYKEGDGYVFMDMNTYEQFTVEADLLGMGVHFIQDNMEVEVEFYNERPIGITLPITVNLKVTSTEDVVKGDTSGNVMKNAELESGYTVQVPAFVKQGEVIKVDTRTGEYIERV